MSASIAKLPKIGNEITVRISLTFQEAPDIHTLLAMTPVRDRGKLVRLALERYIAETAHPAGDVEQQIRAISNWLRSRAPIDEPSKRFASTPFECTTDQEVPAAATGESSASLAPSTSQFVADNSAAPISHSVSRWLDG